MIMSDLKGANRDFYNLLAALRTVSNMYAQMARLDFLIVSGK